MESPGTVVGTLEGRRDKCREVRPQWEGTSGQWGGKTRVARQSGNKNFTFRNEKHAKDLKDWKKSVHLHRIVFS